MLIAARNSPEWYQSQAWKVCDDDATPVIQEACAEADATRDRVEFSPGKYTMMEAVEHGCSLYGIGDVRPIWRSKKPGWMFICKPEPSRFLAPTIDNLAFNGKGVASGVSLDNFQRGTVSNCRFYRCQGSIKTTHAWCSEYRNNAMFSCTGPAFVGESFTGLLSGLGIDKCRNDGPMVSVLTGNCKLENLTIEDCDSGDHPTVLLDRCLTTRLDGFDTERLACSAMVEVRDSTGIILERLEHWQEANSPGRIGTLVKDCRNVRVGPMSAAHFTEAFVRFVRSTGREHWGILNRYPDHGPQPTSLVDYKN
ncbi:hypothetical protein LCGC14_1488700 [marine sediment metagenome]|uniref:Uncharacterized protein n=1 Tax=marine sediment metagenome TaxID=412755 RepID=A0A0F9LMT8_9ZZZZ